jgi:hypothetical protein
MAAKGQLCPPEPAALAAFLVEALPRLQATPAQPIPYGGAHSWDVVADSMESAVLAFLAATPDSVANRSRVTVA